MKRKPPACVSVKVSFLIQERDGSAREALVYRISAEVPSNLATETDSLKLHANLDRWLLKQLERRLTKKYLTWLRKQRKERAAAKGEMTEIDFAQLGEAI